MTRSHLLSRHTNNKNLLSYDVLRKSWREGFRKAISIVSISFSLPLAGVYIFSCDCKLATCVVCLSACVHNRDTRPKASWLSSRFQGGGGSTFSFINHLINRPSHQLTFSWNNFLIIQISLYLLSHQSTFFIDHSLYSSAQLLWNIDPCWLDWVGDFSDYYPMLLLQLYNTMYFH